MKFFKNFKKIIGLTAEIQKINKEIEEAKNTLKKLEYKCDKIRHISEEYKKKYKLLVREIDSPIKLADEIRFIGDDAGIGAYLKYVEVYEEVTTYNNIYDFPLEDDSKAKVTISLRVSEGTTSKKEIFEAIIRAYPKLLEYFRR